MTGKRTWILFGIVGCVAGLAWVVKSGRVGGGGASPVPIMMTPAVASSDGGRADVAIGKQDPLATRPSVSAEKTFTPSKPQAEAKATPLSEVPIPARPPSAPNRPDPSPRSPAETPRVVPRVDVAARASGEQVLELVRAGRLAEARGALKSFSTDDGSAQLVRVIVDLERDLEEVGNLHRARDWFQLEKVLERWDRPGRVVPRPEPPEVAEARVWAEAQRRLRVSQKEWRLALEEALRWENRARIRSLLEVQEYPDDPIRTRARDRLATLERSEKSLAEIRDHLREGRLAVAERMLSTADSSSRPEMKELRDELVRRKADQEALTRKWVSEVNVNGLRMGRADFEDSLRYIPTAQRGDGAVQQAIASARQKVEAREQAARAVVAASGVRPLAPPSASPEPVRVPTNVVPALSPDDEQYQKYRQLLRRKATGDMSPEMRKKTRAFLEGYSKSHPEKAKEIESVLEELKNRF